MYLLACSDRAREFALPSFTPGTFPGMHGLRLWLEQLHERR